MSGPKPQKYHPEYSKMPETAARAKQLGLPLYFTGRECRYGHLSPKYTSSSNCVECIELKRKAAGKRMRGGAYFRSHQQTELAKLALAEGRKTYVGKPCRLGHTERIATTGNCVECSKQSSARAKDRSKWKRIYDLYGLTEEAFNAMLQMQNNQCAICEVGLTDKNTHIDHCHEGGYVRKILCGKCNQALGLFGESTENLKKAIEYLREYGR